LKKKAEEQTKPMANPEHVSLLYQGSTAWNTWKESVDYPRDGPDLTWLTRTFADQDGKLEQ
jgi:hypothetical protein